MKKFHLLKNRTTIKNLKKLKKIIKKSNKILITGHINSDGDNISSQLALSYYLDLINKPHDIIWSDKVPESFDFLPSVEKIKNFTENVDLSVYDTFIIIDSGDIRRIGKISDYITTDKLIINIDHHKGNTNFGTFNVVIEKATSIGEILYYFCFVNKIKISKELAFYLYVSIVSDTGFFRFDLVHPDIHLIASDLLKKGINTYEVNYFLCQRKNFSYIKYLSILLNRVKLTSNDKICYSYLLKEDFDGLENQETDNLVEYLGMLKTVSVYFLIKEKEKGVFNISLRSKFNVDVAKIASFFGGGGHTRAAGCKIENITIQEAINKIIRMLEQEL